MRNKPRRRITSAPRLHWINIRRTLHTSGLFSTHPAHIRVIFDAPCTHPGYFRRTLHTSGLFPTHPAHIRVIFDAPCTHPGYFQNIWQSTFGRRCPDRSSNKSYREFEDIGGFKASFRLGQHGDGRFTPRFHPQTSQSKENGRERKRLFYLLLLLCPSRAGVAKKHVCQKPNLSFPSSLLIFFWNDTKFYAAAEFKLENMTVKKK